MGILNDPRLRFVARFSGTSSDIQPEMLVLYNQTRHSTREILTCGTLHGKRRCIYNFEYQNEYDPPVPPCSNTSCCTGNLSGVFRRNGGVILCWPTNRSERTCQHHRQHLPKELTTIPLALHGSRWLLQLSS